MRDPRRRAAAYFFLLLGASCAAAQPAPPASALPPVTAVVATELVPLTLDEALRNVDQAVSVLYQQGGLAAADGLVRDSQALLANNPVLSADRSRRTVGGQSSDRYREWGATLSQSFEIGGQPRHRREAANAAARAARLEVDDAVRETRGAIAERFFRVLALQQRVDLEVQSLRLFDDAARIVERRRAGGEDTRLEANVALVEAERARNQLALAQEQLTDARAALAALLRMPPNRLPTAVGELAVGELTHNADSLVEAALRQPRLLALVAREESAKARVELERAARYPDVTVGVGAGREGAYGERERVTTLSVSVPLPIWKHNASAIGQATTDASRASLERASAIRDVEADVRATWSRLQSLRTRVDRLQRTVLPTLSTNERLSIQSQRVGQIGLLELIVATRQSVDARRDLIDALLESQLARAALESAAGLSPSGVPR